VVLPKAPPDRRSAGVPFLERDPNEKLFRFTRAICAICSSWRWHAQASIG